MANKFTSMLVQTMTVTRPDPSNGDDDAGTPIDTPTITVAASVPCRAENQIPGKAFIIGKETVIADWLIFCGAVAGLAEGDTVTVDGKDLDVLFVSNWKDGAGVYHHTEIDAREVRY